MRTPSGRPAPAQDGLIRTSSITFHQETVKRGQQGKTPETALTANNRKDTPLATSPAHRDHQPPGSVAAKNPLTQIKADSVDTGTTREAQPGLFDLLADPRLSLRARTALLRRGMSYVHVYQKQAR